MPLMTIPRIPEAVGGAELYRRTTLGLREHPLLQHVETSALRHRFKAIHGPYDDRKDAYDVHDPHRRSNMSATCLLVSSSVVRDVNDAYELQVAPFHRTWSVCPQERFAFQPCTNEMPWTACLVRPNVILTCAHHLNLAAPWEYRVVFGYEAVSPSQVYTTVPAVDVATPVRCLAWRDATEERCADWALLLLDREIRHRPSAAVRPTGPQPGEPVYTAGYPYGLPMKLADGASVYDVLSDGRFTATLDTYQGNSGSPVFSAESHEIIGVVRQAQIGEPDDFTEVPDQHCLVSNYYSYICNKLIGQICVGASCFAQGLPVAGT